MIKRALATGVAISMSACLVEEPEVDGEGDESEEVGEAADAVCSFVPAADESFTNSPFCYAEEGLSGECDYATVEGIWTAGDRYTQAFGSVTFMDSCQYGARAELTVWAKHCAGNLCPEAWEEVSTTFGTSCQSGQFCLLGNCLPTATFTVSDDFGPNTYERVRVGVKGRNGVAYQSWSAEAVLCKDGFDCDLD